MISFRFLDCHFFLLSHKIVKKLFCCCRKHAFVDMASDMDLNKALALNGEEILDKPMKMAKAKVKSNDKKKVKAPPVDKKGKIVQWTPGIYRGEGLLLFWIMNGFLCSYVRKKKQRTRTFHQQYGP